MEVNNIKAELKDLEIQEIASLIRMDWGNVNYAAEPYLDAMSQLKSIDDRYFYDTGKNMVLYFLANAQTWRGEVAREVKAELKARCKNK